jgi:hypothetical protein
MGISTLLEVTLEIKFPYLQQRCCYLRENGVFYKDLLIMSTAKC